VQIKRLQRKDPPIEESDSESSSISGSSAMLPRNTLLRRKPIKYLKKVTMKLQTDKTKRRSLSFAQLERYGKAKTIS